MEIRPTNYPHISPLPQKFMAEIISAHWILGTLTLANLDKIIPALALTLGDAAAPALTNTKLLSVDILDLRLVKILFDVDGVIKALLVKGNTVIEVEPYYASSPYLVSINTASVTAASTLMVYWKPSIGLPQPIITHVSVYATDSTTGEETALAENIENLGFVGIPLIASDPLVDGTYYIVVKDAKHPESSSASANTVTINLVP